MRLGNGPFERTGTLTEMGRRGGTTRAARRRVRDFVALLTLISWPAVAAVAASDWIQSYRDATDRDLLRAEAERDPAQKKALYELAAKKLKDALAARPKSELLAKEYSTDFFDYLPHYHLARAYLGLGRRADAIAELRNEERQGVIARSSVYSDFRSLLSRAEADENQEELRRMRASLDRAIAEAESLEDVAAALIKAQEARNNAQGLDATSIARADALIQKLRDKQLAKDRELEQRKRREAIEADVREARRLLDTDHAADAAARFEDILKRDPFNSPALEGRAAAQTRILASTTRATRERALAEGQRLLGLGDVASAIRLLSEAAADATLPSARELLKRAQTLLDTQQQEEARAKQSGDMRREVDALMAASRFDAAAARIEVWLARDPANSVARTLLDEARNRGSELIINRLLSDREAPALTVLDPRGSHGETFDDTVTVSGFAADDRGLAEVTVTLDGPNGAFDSLPTTRAAPSAKTLPFEGSLKVRHGMNRIVVRAKDQHGRDAETVVTIERKLRFHEKPEFLPLVALGASGLLGSAALVQIARKRRAVRSRFNPYIAGAPVLSDQMFFGRRKLMSRVLNMIHANSLMITGDRRIGKTSFMHHLKRALQEDEGTEFRFFPVSVDLQGVPEKTFFHSVMNEIVDALNPTSVAELRFRPEDENYDDRDFTRDLQRVITELKTRTDKKVKLALLLDEVDELNEYSERVNQRLRSVFMKTFSESIVAVMSGVGIRRSWKSEGSPWYNFFDEFELSGLSREEAEALIRDPVKGVFRFEDDAVDAILDATHLKPYLIQKYCMYTVNRVIESNRASITREDVEAVKEFVTSEDGSGPSPVVTSGLVIRKSETES